MPHLVGRQSETITLSDQDVWYAKAALHAPESNLVKVWAIKFPSARGFHRVPSA
jgi:hypothetical protein